MLIFPNFISLGGGGGGEKTWKPGCTVFRHKGNQTDKSKERHEGLGESPRTGHLVTECCKRQKKKQR